MSPAALRTGRMLPSSKSGSRPTAPEKIQWWRLRTALSLPGLRTTSSKGLSLRQRDEPAHDGTVRLREGGFVERDGLDPADGVVVREPDLAREREDPIGQELDGGLPVPVGHGAEKLARPGLEPQLLGELALEAALRGLAGFELAPGELPEPSGADPLAAAGDQHPSLVLDDRGDDLGQRRRFGL